MRKTGLFKRIIVLTLSMAMAMGMTMNVSAAQDNTGTFSEDEIQLGENGYMECEVEAINSGDSCYAYARTTTYANFTANDIYASVELEMTVWLGGTHEERFEDSSESMRYWYSPAEAVVEITENISSCIELMARGTHYGYVEEEANGCALEVTDY